MNKSKEQIADEIKANKELRPYFIDYLGENLKMTFGGMLELDSFANEKFVEYADTKLFILTRKLKTKVPKKYLDFVLFEVCSYYARVPALSHPNSACAYPCLVLRSNLK